jgi:hypothetical protein
MMQDTVLKKSRTKNTMTYRVFWDIVSAFSLIGNVETFLLKTADPMKLHTIENFPNLLKGKKGWEEK